MPQFQRIAGLTGIIAALGLAGFVTASAQAAEPGLVARLPLDTVSNTSRTPNVGPSGSAYDGGVTAGTLAPARFGSGLTFDTAALAGIDAGPSSDPGAPRPLETSSVSVLAWVKASTTPADKTVLVLKSALTVTRPVGDARRCATAGWMLQVGNTGGPQFVVSTGNGGDLASQVSTASPQLNAASVWDGRWHAIAGTFDAATKQVSIAMDGAVAGSTTAPLGTIDWDLFHGDRNEMTVAHFPNADSCDQRRYRGGIDEIRVYDKALSSAELGYLQDPAAGGPRELPVPSPTTTPTETPTPTPTPSSTPTPAPVTTPTPGPELLPTGEPDVAARYAKLVQELGRSDFTGNAYEVLTRAMLQFAAQQRQQATIDRYNAHQAVRTESLRQADQLRAAAQALIQGATANLSVAGTAGAVSIGAGVIQITSFQLAGGTSTVTTVGLPPVAAPVSGGKAALQFPDVSSKVDPVLRNAGRITDVKFAVKTASLPTSEINQALDAQVDASMAALQNHGAEFDQILDQLKAALADRAKVLSGASFRAAAARVASRPTKARAKAKAKADAKVRRLRAKLRHARRKRDQAARRAAVVSAPAFAAAGADSSPIAAYRIKGCAKQRCPFAAPSSRPTTKKKRR